MVTRTRFLGGAAAILLCAIASMARADFIDSQGHEWLPVGYTGPGGQGLQEVFSEFDTADWYSWSNIAAYFNPLTGRAYDPNDPLIWATSTEVFDVFDELARQPLGTSVPGAALGAEFAVFGATMADPLFNIVGWQCYEPGITRDDDLILSVVDTYGNDQWCNNPSSVFSGAEDVYS